MAGMLDMEYRIWVEKVTLVSSILFQHEDNESFAREILEEEISQGWVGLSSEVKEICRETGLPDATKKYVAGRHHHLQLDQGQGRDAGQGPQEAEGDGQVGLQKAAGLHVQCLVLR